MKRLSERAWSANQVAVVRRPVIKAAMTKSPFVWPDFRGGVPQWQTVNFAAYVEEGFDLNQIVYAAIMYKARAMLQVPLRAYTGDPDQPDLLPETHPLSALCLRPNPHQSFSEFQSQNVVYLNLAGNVYIAKMPGQGGLPSALYSLRPDRVFIIPETGTAKTGIKGFLYVPEGRSAWANRSEQDRVQALSKGEVSLFLPEDMIHVKLTNPGDPLEGMGYGLSPIKPGARPIDVDNAVTSFLKIFFERGTQMQGILSFDDPIEPEDMAEIRERWSEVYGGYENWDQIGVLDQGGKYQRISPTFDEMGFETIDERNETRILGPFGVPPILIGSRIGLMRSTYANYSEARRACWEDTLVPELRMFEVDYHYHLSGNGAFVAYDLTDVPALKKDVPALVAAWAVLVGNGVPKDVATETIGLPMESLPDGQVIYMPQGLVPVDAEGNTTREPPPSPFMPGMGGDLGGDPDEDGDLDEDVDPDEDVEEEPVEIACLRCGGQAKLLQGLETKGENLFRNAPRGLYFCSGCNALIDRRHSSFTL